MYVNLREAQGWAVGTAFIHGRTIATFDVSDIVVF
jgi:hypothetical protein